MTVQTSPSFALRPQRDGLRQTQVFLSRPRAASLLAAGSDGLGGAAPDCVFKRFPAIGDTPPQHKQHW